MKYKLVCIDVDGTLLTTGGKVTEQTKAVLQEVHKRGIHVVVSTGRMYTDAAYYSDLIGVRSPVIASNGALIKEKENNRIIYQSILGESLSLRILEVFRAHGVTPFFCTPDKFYYGNILFKIFYLLAKIRGRRNNPICSEYVFSWQRWRHVLRKEKENMVKCEIIHRDIHSLQSLCRDLRSISQLELVESSKHNIEINCKGVSKGKALEFLADFYHFAREEVIAIGDSGNDTSMLEYAGLGIAMGNAAAAVKERADYVTASNNEDGVAEALIKFILKRQF
ncbi:hypothetical protein P22_0823 [Propionispora sp. 2/2-37]|uniref:Cof-type HAD-IIB family hydrolase n=1 Tax=Propionispora sp. 2/2-37 TaxID=1677858 RepID=UPI0006BB6377|nr:Cof-type HAD-IIB family hydrolase [Propionispora sp. 2/2-37]CUH94757.1 hypothetical protein P22_0823 [Propionispora sp. 2/2-37]